MYIYVYIIIIALKYIKLFIIKIYFFPLLVYEYSFPTLANLLGLLNKSNIFFSVSLPLLLLLSSLILLILISF